MHRPDWRSGRCHQQLPALTDIQHDISLVCLPRHAQLRPIDCNGLYDCEYRTGHVSQVGSWTIDWIRSIRVRFVRLLCLLCISVCREGTSEEQRGYNIATTFDDCSRTFEECSFLGWQDNRSIPNSAAQTNHHINLNAHRSNGLPSHPPRMASPYGP